MQVMLVQFAKDLEVKRAVATCAAGVGGRRDQCRAPRMHSRSPGVIPFAEQLRASREILGQPEPISMSECHSDPVVGDVACCALQLRVAPFAVESDLDCTVQDLAAISGNLCHSRINSCLVAWAISETLVNAHRRQHHDMPPTVSKQPGQQMRRQSTGTQIPLQIVQPHHAASYPPNHFRQCLHSSTIHRAKEHVVRQASLDRFQRGPGLPGRRLANHQHETTACDHLLQLSAAVPADKRRNTVSVFGLRRSGAVNSDHDRVGDIPDIRHTTSAISEQLVDGLT